MSEWKEYQLGEILNFIDGDRGKNYPGKEDFFENAYCLFLNTGNVTSNGFNFEETSFITQEKDSMLRKGRLDRFDVVLTTRGTVGNVAYYDSSVPYNCVRINSGMLIVRARKAVLNSYIYQLFRSEYMQSQFSLFASGSAQPQLPVKDLVHVTVKIPDLLVQKKVFFTISAYDNLIENNNRRIAILEEMAQKLYREWFVHFRFPGHENVKMVESKMGLIPEGWKTTILKELCQRIFSGGTPATSTDEYWNGDLPWLSSGETRDEYIISTEKTITEEGAKNSSTRFANKFNIVVASAGQGKTRGQTSLLLLDTYINQSVISIETLEKHEAYIYFNIKGRYDELRHFSDSSSIRGSLTVQIFNSLPILAPSENVVEKFEKIALSFITQIEALLKKNTNLRKTRDLLLPHLISGDIDVSNLDIPIKEG
ncbi:restriction endonuclease subunit S [Anaerorhabdus sp.]|uniref:restriction endonuclease subunit S n=1 Tax=Anaerorhabdus sp. TaxID=1872524 RepID=UPI002FC9AC79